MATFFPTDPKKLRERIGRYERALKANDDDGYGKRFLVGPMYLLMGDLNGALKYYDWYKEAFPDDGVEPGNHLCWTLALYRAGMFEAAARKLRETMFENLYLIPFLLGMEVKRHDMWHGSNWAEPEFVEGMPEELFPLWDEKAKAWAREVYERPAIMRDRERFIEIHAQLKTLKPGSERSRLVTESFQLQRGEPMLRLVENAVPKSQPENNA